MKTRKKILWSAGIIIVSFVVACIWGKFNYEAFLIDDNRTQWFPVIERAYDGFFKNGHMAIYDFFQLKGLAIAEPGYYSIMNPMMLVSYMLSHFTFLTLSTLTVYIALMFSFGNTFFFWLCKELGYNEPESVLFTLGYSVISVFFSFGYWYYVFNNQLFIPLLLYVFVKTQGTKLEYVGCGCVLGFEILFGNVQYTCYHYIVYGILCVSFVIFKNKKKIGVFFSNVGIGLFLSAPFLLLMLRSGKNFKISEARDMSLKLKDLLFGTVAPNGIINETGMEDTGFFSNVMFRNDHSWLYNGFFVAFFVILIVIFIKKRDKNKDLKFKTFFKELYRTICSDQRKQFTVGALLCLLFYLSYACDGIVGYIMSIMPVVKNFRYEFKCLFIIGPVFSAMVVSFAGSFPKKTVHFAAAVSSIFIAVGMVNNYFVVKQVNGIFMDNKCLTLEGERSVGEKSIEKLDWDTSLYRNAVVLKQFPTISRYYWNGLFRNFPTAMGVYSLSAYEISANPDHIKSFDKIYEFNEYNTRMLNAGMFSYVYQEAQDEPEEFAEQLRQNAVRYVFVQQQYEVNVDVFDALDYTAELVRVFDSLEGIEVERVCPISDCYNVIVLSGTNALCTDGTNAVPLSADTMDVLSFETTGASEYTLSFCYDEHLKAELHSGESIIPLETSANKFNNTTITVPDGRNGTVVFSYKDGLCTAGFVFEILSTSVFVCVMILIAVKGSRIRKPDADGEEDTE